MTNPKHSYLIVGAGVFGVSTAYYLIKRYPEASITVVDREAYDADSRVAASWDWNKVVRADYDDIVYCQLALEAQDIFNEDPLWKPYFHQTGIYWMCRSDYAQDVINNYKKLGRKADLSAVPIAEARKLYGGLFDDADYTDVKEVLVNKTSGWCAARDCLRAVTKHIIELGVKYVVADVETLVFEQSRCIGIRSTKGEVVGADKVILSTGAYTAKLLELTAKAAGVPELSADGRIVAGGITTGMTKLDDKSYKRFAKMPVGVQGYDAKAGPFIGSLPPTPDGELKWWGQTIFTNVKEILPGRWLSAPPAEPDYAQWQVSGRLKEDIDHANHVFYGRRVPLGRWRNTGFVGKEITPTQLSNINSIRDAFTTSADFIISPHAGAKGLYVATGGNFHGFKFFPVLGKYIVQMLEGSLDANLAQKWAWDRERPDSQLNPDYPRAEMKDLLDKSRQAKL